MDAGTGGWYRREAVRHGWRDRRRRSEALTSLSIFWIEGLEGSLGKKRK
jgi:hypothetical protein